jgi:hypothetical protein
MLSATLSLKPRPEGPRHAMVMLSCYQLRYGHAILLSAMLLSLKPRPKGPRHAMVMLSCYQLRYGHAIIRYGHAILLSAMLLSLCYRQKALPRGPTPCRHAIMLSAMLSLKKPRPEGRRHAIYTAMLTLNKNKNKKIKNKKYIYQMLCDSKIF